MFIFANLKLRLFECLSAYNVIHTRTSYANRNSNVKDLVSACIRIYVFIIQDVTKSFELAILQKSLGGNPRTATGMDGALPR